MKAKSIEMNFNNSIIGDEFDWSPVAHEAMLFPAQMLVSLWQTHL
jgi:hypothetical protein